MSRLDVYIMRTVTSTMLLASVGLLGILTLFTFLEQIEDMQNNYDVAAVLAYCLYSTPRIFYEISPFAALIGCLAGLGMLASSSELVIMRAAGISTWAISWSALKPTLAFIVFAMAIGEFVLPDLERIARNDRMRALSVEQQITPLYGFWYREGNVYMHFDEVSQNGVLSGITHYYFDDSDRLLRSLYARRAVYHDVREGEQYWLMEDVRITEISPTGTDARQLTSFRWETRLEPDLLSTEILVEADRMSIRELRAKLDYMQSQGLNTDKFELGYWQKLLQPLATIGLVFVAISFIFGPLRESTMGMRVVSGLIIGILFKFIQDLLSPASIVFGFSPLIAVMTPILLCAAFGYWLLRRAG